MARPSKHSSKFLWLWSAGVVLPLVWVLLQALRSKADLTLHGGITFPTGITFENFKLLTQSNIFIALANSVLVTCLALAVNLAVSVPAAYAFGKLKPIGKPLAYSLLVGGLIAPSQLVLVPLLLAFSGWQVEPRLALAVIYGSFAIPFSVFILASFAATIPSSYRDAARLDGASETQTFVRVLTPLLKSGIIVIASFNVIGFMSEFLYALVFLTADKTKTLPLALYSLAIQSQYSQNLGLICAGTVFVLIPCAGFYLVAQRAFLSKGGLASV